MQIDNVVLAGQRLSRRVVARMRPIIPLLSTLVVIGASLFTFCIQKQLKSHAASSSVVSQPSLSADTVNRILSRAGSPMVGTGATIEQMARTTGIDDAFALAVWWTETNDGEAGVGINNRNPGSVRGSASYAGDSAGYTIYPSYDAAIRDWFQLLKNSYVARGLSDVYAISNPYVGTAGAGNWAAKVMNLMIAYRQEAPKPSTGPVPLQLQATHTAPVVAEKSPAPVSAQQKSSQSQHAQEVSIVGETTPTGDPYQLPLAGTLAAVAVGACIIIARLRRTSARRKAAVTRQAHINGRITEALPVCRIGQDIIPPTPQLAQTGQIPLTPLVHARSEYTTEDFALPPGLRLKRAPIAI